MSPAPLGSRFTAAGAALGAKLGARVQKVAKTGRAVSTAGSGAAKARLRELKLPEAMTPRADDGVIVAIYFADPPASLYQLDQWLWPIEQLAHTMSHTTGAAQPVAIVTRNASTALKVAERTSLPVKFARKTAALDVVMTQPELRVVCYVNQATLNFQGLKYRGPAHVHLSHGESEKISMISNQLKAYDYIFTAGAAARARILDTLVGYAQQGGEARMIDIGRPQLDEPVAVPAAWVDRDRGTGPVVFYAPTWEGDSPAMAYGTLPRSGPAVVSALLGAGYRVIYRPHPRTGSVRAEFAEADAAIRARLQATRGSWVDDSPRVGWQPQVADACVAEMSSVAFDWLATGKPLVLLRPEDPAAELLPGGLFDRVPSIHVTKVDRLAGALRDQAATSQAHSATEHYFGDTQPGAQQARFEAAVLRLSEHRQPEDR